MWTALVNENQIMLDGRIRQIAQDGEINNITEFKILKLGKIFFLAQMEKQNGKDLSDDAKQIIPYCYPRDSIFGFEVYIEE